MSEQERPSDATGVDFKKYAEWHSRNCRCSDEQHSGETNTGDSANLSDAPDDAGAASS